MQIKDRVEEVVKMISDVWAVSEWLIAVLCVQKRAMGSVLYEKVLYHLDLVETDYFGLQFSDTSNVNVSLSRPGQHAYVTDQGWSVGTVEWDHCPQCVGVYGI